MLQSILTPEQIAFYHTQGYLVVPDLLTQDEVASFLHHTPYIPIPLHGHETDAQFRALAHHPKIAGGAQQLTGGPLRIVQTMFLDKPPQGGVGIAMHQDSHYLPNEPNTLMACWVALSDTDGDNGGLCVVPGSHRGGLRPAHQNMNSEDHASWKMDHTMSDREGRRWTQTIVSFEIDGLDMGSIVRLTVPRGWGVYFTGMTIHGSFANRSPDRPRRAFATHYIHRDTWLFREDVQKAVPVEEA
jgi:ectoine hydroxylase-related dioxygenase (phytanoyl-CoA dioxygenase family)